MYVDTNFVAAFLGGAAGEEEGILNFLRLLNPLLPFPLPPTGASERENPKTRWLI